MGKRLVKSLTVDPISDGFKEYELKMDSVQNIMNGTGESLETVMKYLNELNKIFPKCRTIDCSQTGLFPFYDDHENDWI